MGGPATEQRGPEASIASEQLPGKSSRRSMNTNWSPLSVSSQVKGTVV